MEKNEPNAKSLKIVNPQLVGIDLFCSIAKMIDLRVKINGKSFRVEDMGDVAFYNIALAQRLQFNVSVEQGNYIVADDDYVKVSATTTSTPSIFHGVDKQHVIRLFDNSQKLAAVKYVKDVSGMGLKEAKEYAEEIYEKHIQGRNPF